MIKGLLRFFNLIFHGIVFFQIFYIFFHIKIRLTWKKGAISNGKLNFDI